MPTSAFHFTEAPGSLYVFNEKGACTKFQCICFRLGPVPLVFTKLMKISIAVLRRLKIRVIVYLDDMLLMSHTVDEILMARNTLIFLLQHLEFIKYNKKFYPSNISEDRIPRFSDKLLRDDIHFATGKSSGFEKIVSRGSPEQICDPL